MRACRVSYVRYGILVFVPKTDVLVHVDIFLSAASRRLVLREMPRDGASQRRDMLLAQSLEMQVGHGHGGITFMCPSESTRRPFLPSCDW